METILNAIDLIKGKRDSLQKIISIGCPFEAFQLLALHIDFLGKLLHRLKPEVTTAWEKDKPDAKTCFDAVCTQLSSMAKYDKDILRDNLRNGMIHNEAPKPHLWLTHEDKQTLDQEDIVININDIYSDFRQACDDAIKMLKTYEHSHPGSLASDKKFPRIILKDLEQSRKRE